MSSYEIVSAGESRSFPADHPFIAAAGAGGDGIVFVGAHAGAEFARRAALPGRSFVAVELGAECLGEHTGEQHGNEGSNVVGFARFRLGNAEPSDLVELVRQPATSMDALAAARQAFEAAGLSVAVSADAPGRIVDRLLRPYLNAALRRLDDGLATADDMDLTLRLGLGYPEGPIALLERTGLAHHHDVTQALYRSLGDEAFRPARRAQVAAARRDRGSAPGGDR
jgi:3-hydroxybutyryl-CoA dehydrogenase